MTANSHKQSQFELFPRSKDEKVSNSSKKCVVLKDLTLSVENIILLSIILVMGFVLFFSFGVERGKQVVLADQDDSVQSIALQEDIEIKQASDTIAKTSSEAIIDPLKETEGNEVREVIKIPQVQEIEINENFFTIQVASFKLDKNAQKEAETLRNKGFEIYVLPKGRYSIVCVGKFNQKSEANDFAVRLKHRYNDYLVRRL